MLLGNPRNSDSWLNGWIEETTRPAQHTPLINQSWKRELPGDTCLIETHQNHTLLTRPPYGRLHLSAEPELQQTGWQLNCHFGFITTPEIGLKRIPTIHCVSHICSTFCAFRCVESELSALVLIFNYVTLTTAIFTPNLGLLTSLATVLCLQIFVYHYHPRNRNSSSFKT